MRSSLKDRVEWVFVRKPSEEDFEFLEKNFPLPEEIIQVLRRPVLRPRLTQEGVFKNVILHVPVYDKKERHAHGVEVDLLTTDGHIVTVSFGDVPALAEVYKEAQKDEEKRRHLLGHTSEQALREIIIALLKFIDRELDHVQEKLDKTERMLTIKHAHRKDVLEDLAALRRDILDVRRVVKPEREVFEDLATAGGSCWKALLSEYDRLFNRIENHKEAVEALYDTFTALVSVRANEIVRILTIIATITFPLALFASLFQMNTRYTPIVGTLYDFWIILGIIILATGWMLAVFKARNWF